MDWAAGVGGSAKEAVEEEMDWGQAVSDQDPDLDSAVGFRYRSES